MHNCLSATGTFFTDKPLSGGGKSKCCPLASPEKGRCPEGAEG